jgi:hypothetical protein
MAHLALVEFLAEDKSVTFLGPPGTGKSYLSIAWNLARHFPAPSDVNSRGCRCELGDSGRSDTTADQNGNDQYLWTRRSTKPWCLLAFPPCCQLRDILGMGWSLAP